MPTETQQPAFVLVRPQMGENIGAAARAMWNFGLDRMRIVHPRDGWPNQKAVAMASGAGRVLDGALLVAAAGATDLTDIDTCARQLDALTHNFGVVLNKSEFMPRRYYQYDYY